MAQATVFPSQYWVLEYWPLEYWPYSIASVYSTDPRRIYVVSTESRIMLVEDEQRRVVVPGEDRTTLTEAES